MKVKCNVCIESPIIEIPEEVEIDKIIYCPSCGKQIAWGSEGYGHEKDYWSIPDSSYNEEWGGIPIEILK